MSYYLIRVGQGSKYIDEAKRVGFVAIDFDEVPDLDNFSNFDDLKTFLKNKYNYSSAQLGAQAGQIIRFGYEMENGDHVISPIGNGQYAVGIVDKYYYEKNPSDRCPFRHRRKIKWLDRILSKDDMSTRLSFALGATLTIFSLEKYADELEALVAGKTPTPAEQPQRIRDIILSGLLELGGKEFEEFVSHLLSIIGFQATTTQYTNDKGIDVIGILDAEGLADISVHIQAKRTESAIGRKIVQELRGAVNRDEHPCIITLGTFHKNAIEAAEDEGKVPVKLIDGNDLASLVLKHFDNLDEEYKKRFSIRKRKDFNIEDWFEIAQEASVEQDQPQVVTEKTPEWDTIVCSAKEDGFKMAFLEQKAWWAVRISAKYLPFIKYLAMYQVAPISAITYYGEVERIEPYNEDPSKYKLYLKGDPIKLKKIVGLGKNPHLKPQGPRYAKMDEILKAQTLDDIFGNNSK